jgi:hypothetical protein
LSKENRSGKQIRSRKEKNQMSLVLTRNNIAELLPLILPFGLLDAELLGDIAQFLPSFISPLEKGNASS